MNQQDIVQGLREERERTVAYLRSLPSDAWERASLCEGWSVRDVVAHLTGNCADVLEQNMEGLGSRESNQRQVDARAAMTPDDMLAEWAEKGPACEAIYEAFPAQMWDYPMDGVIGTIGRGVLRHLEDLWVHTQDIRIPLGDDTTAGPGLDAVFALCETEIPLALSAANSDVAAIELDFPDRDRTIKGSGSGATVRISGDPVTFALVVTGRRPLDHAQAEGLLLVEPAIDARALYIYGAAFDART